VSRRVPSERSAEGEVLGWLNAVTTVWQCKQGATAEAKAKPARSNVWVRGALL
jgi:hypothetical protein